MTVLPQHLQALERANEVRLARHKLKGDINAGDVSASDVIAAPPEYATTMTVLDVVMAQRYWGMSRSRRVLRCAQVGDSVVLRALSDRQRRALVERLP